MFITVAICTWNNAKLLDQTLSQMQKLEIPDGVTWELLVVDNNCTDNTEEIIEKHAEQLPIRRLVETKQGHTHARNCAVAGTRGDLILWTDDDVLVDPRWLKEYAQAAIDNPDVDFFGGPVLPLFEGDPPKWLTRAWPNIAGVYAVRDLGDEPLYFDDDRLPFGANFAVRTPVQRRYPFDPNLGRRKDALLGGDETTVLRAMMADGSRGRWIPAAPVKHFLPRRRLTLSYVRDYYYCQGKVYAMRGREATARTGWQPSWLSFLGMIFYQLRYRVRRMLLGDPAKWVADMNRSSFRWGYWLQRLTNR